MYAGIPTATAIKQRPTTPELIPGTVTATINDIKATFSDGVVPVDIDLAHASKSSPNIVSFQSSLLVFWFESTRTVWLEFEDEAKATTARRALDQKEFAGVSFTAKSDRSGNTRTVVVTGLHASITKAELLEALPSDAKPAHSHFGRLTYPTSVRADAEVRKEIEALTALRIDREEHRETRHASKSCRAFFFDGNPDLKALAKELSGRVVPALGKTMVYADQYLSMRLRVPTRVLLEKKREFNQVASAACTMKIRVAPFANEDSHATIQMFASDRHDLVNAKKRIDDLFSTFRKVYSANMGDPLTQTHRIKLTKTAAYKEATKVVGQIKEEFGEDVVAFNEESDPPSVVVTGNTSMLRRVQKRLRGDRPSPKSKTIACVICLDDEADDFVEIDGCGHTACTECIVNYCTTRPDDGTRTFPLRCFHQECDQPLSLRQVHSLLTEEQLKPILSESLRDHIKRHPAEFAHCPGKKCSKLYRKSDTNNSQQLCNECLASFCACCGVDFHFGMSCEEYQERIIRDERDMALWMEANGAKRCPSCTAVVQKIEGCNNMECPGCKTYFCWVCLATAAGHQEVYRHLVGAHGGFFDNEAEAFNHAIGDMAPEEAAMNGFAIGNALGREEMMRAVHALREDVRALRVMDANVRRPAPPQRPRAAPHPQQGFMPGGGW